MKKKLQVFISSTYIDMLDERQAAVTAVLNAGHISAGMELFKSGDQSQKETIKRWIDESDVYMLILGGRYGSIDAETGKSYTHWEYDYAGEQGKRRFAIVINEKRLMEKARENPDFLEREHFSKYQEFKTQVLGNISKFYEDAKDIKLIVMESLKEYEGDEQLVGWVRSDLVANNEKIREENTKLLKENSKLKLDLEKYKSKTTQKDLINDLSYTEVKKALEQTRIVSDTNEISEKSLLRLFIGFSDSLNVGISNSMQSDKLELFLFYDVAPKLQSFGLMEKVKVSGVKWQRYQTSKEGLKFQARYRLENPQ